MKIRPVEAELLHANRRADTKKLTVAFRNSANAPNKNHIASKSTHWLQGISAHSPAPVKWLYKVPLPFSTHKTG